MTGPGNFFGGDRALSEAEYRAFLLASSVESALAKGVMHFDPETGEVLATALEVVECMVEKGSVTVQEPVRNEETEES